MVSNCLSGNVQAGNRIRVYGTFTNAVSDPQYDPFDPALVYVTVKSPDGTQTTYQYLVDPNVLRESPGVYYIEIDIDLAGDWYIKWHSEGAGKCSTEVVLKVLSTVT